MLPFCSSHPEGSVWGAEWVRADIIMASDKGTYNTRTPCLLLLSLVKQRSNRLTTSTIAQSPSNLQVTMQFEMTVVNRPIFTHHQWHYPWQYHRPGSFWIEDTFNLH